MPNQEELAFRAADLNDADILFHWKNDPLTRRASLDSREVGWEEHLDWIAGVLRDPKRKIELAFFSDKPNELVGVVRFDSGGAETELSWTVAPQMRGRGIGKEMVKAAALRRPGAALIARIKAGNSASEAIAVAAGFIFERSVDGVSYWRKS